MQGEDQLLRGPVLRPVLPDAVGDGFDPRRVIVVPLDPMHARMPVADRSGLAPPRRKIEAVVVPENCGYRGSTTTSSTPASRQALQALADRRFAVAHADFDPRPAVQRRLRGVPPAARSAPAAAILPATRFPGRRLPNVRPAAGMITRFNSGSHSKRGRSTTRGSDRNSRRKRATGLRSGASGVPRLAIRTPVVLAWILDLGHIFGSVALWRKHHKKVCIFAQFRLIW